MERGKIHEFANSVLDDHPLYHDEIAAQAQGFPSVMAPPTFSSAASFFAGRADLRLPAGLDLRYVLHGGQEFVFERPLFAGDVLTPESGEMTTYEKAGQRGGTMKFIDTETVYHDQRGAIVLRVKSTLIQTSGVLR